MCLLDAGEVYVMVNRTDWWRRYKIGKNKNYGDLTKGGNLPKDYINFLEREKFPKLSGVKLAAFLEAEKSDW